MIMTGNINRYEPYLRILTGNINRCETYLVILTLPLPTVMTNTLDLRNETSPRQGESPKHNAYQSAIPPVKSKDSNILQSQPSLYIYEIIAILCATVPNLTQLNTMFLARQSPVGEDLPVHRVSRSHTTTHHRR
jgi:hypothetical protein